MINGAHVIVYSSDAEKDKAFFRDVLKFGHVDAGHGWLIFRLPPAEMARLQEAGVSCEAATQQRWGLLTHLTLPGGGRLGLYQPRHARP